MTEKVITRAYNRFQDVPFGLLKKESDTERLADEIGYYREIQRDINKAIYFPRLMGSHIGTPNWLIIEKYSYEPLSHYFFRDNYLSWDSIFRTLITLMIQFDTFTDMLQSYESTARHAYKMYHTKTRDEYFKFVESRPDLKELFDAPSITINKKSYINFWPLWISSGGTKQYLESMTGVGYTSTMIHGDFCLSNILYGPKYSSYKYVDPRGSFGDKKGIYGDIRYDVAKLAHSVEGGYDLIINDRFSVTSNSTTSFDYSLGCNDERQRARDSFEQTILTGFNKKEIKIIQGCIFIGMCARHYDSKERQLIMYLTGVKLLNEGMEL
jgi:hypothetical protein